MPVSGEQPDDRGVPPGEEVAAVAGLEKHLHLLDGQHGDRLLRHLRRFHPGHRVDADLVLVEHPLEPLLHGPVPVRRGGGRPGVQQRAYPVLDHRLLDLPRVADAPVCQVRGELLGAGPVGAQCRVGQVAGAQGAHPGGQQRVKIGGRIMWCLDAMLQRTGLTNR